MNQPSGSPRRPGAVDSNPGFSSATTFGGAAGAEACGEGGVVAHAAMSASAKAKDKPPKPRYTRGLLAKYMRLVSTASKGAITDAS